VKTGHLESLTHQFVDFHNTYLQEGIYTVISTPSGSGLMVWRIYSKLQIILNWTHMPRIYGSLAFAPITCPVNKCRRKWLFPPRALCFRKTMMTVLLWYYVLWEERSSFQINLWSVKSARSVLHCTKKHSMYHSLGKSIWGALRAGQHSLLLGQASTVSYWCSEPWNQF
jgi:hypothetical protein